MTERTRSTAEHPLFAAPLKHFLAYMALRLPYCFWLEEVKGFTVPLDALGGVSPATYVAKKVEALGYACECLILDHCLWARSKRERVFSLVVTQIAGVEMELRSSSRLSCLL